MGGTDVHLNASASTTSNQPVRFWPSRDYTGHATAFPTARCFPRGLFSCSRAPPVRASTGLRAGVRLTPCRIDGFPEEIKCTSVSVPESRTGASDRRVSIHVAIVPALARVAARDPLVLLAGGPGQAASSFGPWIASVFAPIRRHRDILLIDQTRHWIVASAPVPCRRVEHRHACPGA